MHIVVIIPTYNEKVNIKNLIPVLQTEVFPKIKGHEMSILVADDGSPDGTQGVVEGFVKEYKNVHLLEGKKEGLGKAYARAMRYAMDILHADAVLEFDADFQHDPHDIPRLIAALDKGADYVIGSRYIKGGQIPKEWGLDRKLKSRFGGLFARYMFLMLNIHDMTSGFKLTKTSFLSKVDLEHLFSYNYAYKMHILHDVVRLGARVKEVPIIFYERTSGKSKMDTNDIVDSLLVVIRLTLTDKDGGIGTQTYSYVSVYNPTQQGLFSAGQKYTSQPGAYLQSPNITGSVMFGLSYKYQGDIPVDNRQFSMDFNSADFHFNATSINSLVIANGIGTLRGTGEVNGSGIYSFLVSGNENTDTIRIQIKDDLGNVIYDTQPSAADIANPTTTLSAGIILAH